MAQRWTTVIASSVHGLDQNGTAGTAPWNNFGPTKDRPGIIQINLHVRRQRGPLGMQVPLPIVTQEARITGVGPSIMSELRNARIPLAEVNMHREIDFTFTDAYSGAALRAGLVQMSPDGFIEFDSNANLFDFAEMSRGDVPDSSHGALVDEIAAGSGKADLKDAARIVRQLLTTSGLTTANLFHDENIR